MFEEAECFQSCPFSSLRLKENNKIKIEKDLQKKTTQFFWQVSPIAVPPLK